MTGTSDFPGSTAGTGNIKDSPSSWYTILETFIQRDCVLCRNCSSTDTYTTYQCQKDGEPIFNFSFHRLKFLVKHLFNLIYNFQHYTKINRKFTNFNYNNKFFSKFLFFRKQNTPSSAKRIS